MPNYKLLAIDLDDTLLNSNKEISDQNKYWVAKAVEAGVTVIFATGRGIQRVEHLKRDLDLHGPMVLLNGAEVWQAPNQLLYRRFLQHHDIQLLYRRAEAKGAATWGYSVQSLTRFTDQPEKLLEEQWMKFGIRHESPEVIAHLKDDLSELDTITVTSSAINNLEISAKGVSKEIGVQKVCDYLQFEREDVMAIGDNLNDLQLLQYAGLGIAMGNADDQIKRIADHVTDTNEHDGVATAIKRYLLN